MHRALSLLPLVLAVAGCGEAERSVVTRSAVTAPLTPAGKGRLEIVKTFPGGPVFVEGSQTHVRLVNADGHAVAGKISHGGPPAAILRRDLPPGTYHLVTVERPCDGNCGQLDPPVDETRCRLDVEVRRSSVSRVTIAVVRAADGAAVHCDVTRG
jgi:hypothetical protein